MTPDKLFDQEMDRWASTQPARRSTQHPVPGHAASHFFSDLSPAGEHDVPLDPVELQRIRTANYPTEDCLRPHDVEGLSNGADLPEAAVKHLTQCPACTAMVAALTVDRERLGDFLTEVRAGTARWQSHRTPREYAAAVPLEATDEVSYGINPLIIAICNALKRVATSVDTHAKRRTLFRGAIKHARRLYANSLNWELGLVAGSDEVGMPGWAVECLPSLHIPLSDSGGHALVWHYVLACIPKPYPCRPITSLCNNIVWEVLMPLQTATLVQRIAPLFDAHRQGNPFPTNVSMPK